MQIAQKLKENLIGKQQEASMMLVKILGDGNKIFPKITNRLKDAFLHLFFRQKILYYINIREGIWIWTN